MSVSSDFGKGSTFTVWLPEWEGVPKGTGLTDASRSVTSRPASMETILVVDDEAPIRRMLRKMLEREGYRVLEASDGREAVRLQAAEPADLVITDLFMPEVDGFETIREIRKLSSRVGILAISGGGKTVKEDLLPYAEMLGANRILSKPLKRRELIDAIREIETRE